MVCSNCGTEDRPGRKFCGGCAAPLAVACPGWEATERAASRAVAFEPAGEQTLKGKAALEPLPPTAMHELLAGLVPRWSNAWDAAPACSAGVGVSPAGLTGSA